MASKFAFEEDDVPTRWTPTGWCIGRSFQGGAERLVEGLFVTSFQQGENMGDRAVLCRVAAAGYDAAAVGGVWLA